MPLHCEHIQILTEVLEANLNLKQDQVSLLRPYLEHLGHIIDANGRHPMEEKTQAIRDAPTPTNVAELCLFFLNYYSKFLLNFLLICLTAEEENQMELGDTTGGSFPDGQGSTPSKFPVSSLQPSKPLLLACDASQYDVGTILSHVNHVHVLYAQSS